MARPKKGVTFWDRVWEHTFRTERGCLEFRGCWNGDGYGRIRRNGKAVLVHREAWKKFHGPIPRGKLVLHRCDNPCCWEKMHLFLGTHAENMADKAAKGRVISAHGEKNQEAKLTNRQVRQIKARLIKGDSCAEIARDYGVTDVAVGFIERGKKWQTVGPEVPYEGYRHPSKLSDSQIKRIRRDRRRVVVIAAQYGVSTVQIYRIKRGECWKNLR